MLLPIDQDEDSQDVAALLNRSQSVSHAGAGAAAAQAPTKEADALAALAKASSGSFRFTMFGRDLTNSQDQQQQVSWRNVWLLLATLSTEPERISRMRFK